MASKLKTLSTSYQSFQEDQVLTHDQLNRFLGYFDDQDRLSRVMLSGVGLSCGFDVSFGVADGDQFIRVSKGVGVTTDGDILNLLNKNSDGELSVHQGDKIYPYFREFVDEKANYDHFIQGSTPLAPMFELITNSAYDASLGDQPISALTNYKDRVVLLYLEAYQNEGELCDGLSCDNQGVEEVARLRVLLLTKTQANAVISKDPLYRKNDRREVYHQLTDITVKRIVLTEDEYLSVSDLRDKFAINNAVVSQLKSSLEKIANKLQGYVPSGLIPDINAILLAKLNANSGISPGLFQYRHDFLVELVDVYTEIKDLFLRFSSECIPPLQSFPKHLMLGIVDPTDLEKKHLKYRHQFYKSSLLEEFGEEFNDFLFLLTRMKMMLTKYIDLGISPIGDRNAIRITPSYLSGEVGQGAVPYYYDVNDALLEKWNAQKTFEGKFKRNLSYHISKLHQSDQFTAPLDFNFRKNDLFRIEGHQGKNYIEAFEAIDNEKKDKGLPFDVKVLALNENAESTINYDDYACHFEDLQLLLEAWSKEQQCTLAKATALLSGFSISEPGSNVVDDAFDAPIGTAVLFDDYIKDFGAVAAYGQGLNSGKLSTTGDKMDTIDGKMDTIGSKMSTTGMALTSMQGPLMYESPVMMYVTTPVQDNIATDENTVGAAFLYALDNAQSSTPDSWIASADYFADQIKQTFPDANWFEPAYDVLINNSFTLLAYAQDLSGSVPINLSSINTTVVDNYQTKITNLCTAVSQAQLAYTDSLEVEGIADSVSSKNRTILGLAVNQLNSICCAARKINTLFEEIEERTKTILRKTVLTEFKKQHPSLEHIAGVQPGGTFVMVYNNQGGSKKVIADFALPYMCCSDCAPVNFVLNQPAASLQLTGGSPICLESTEEVRRPFVVQPVDGVITADPEITGITIEGNELVIDPTTFPAANYGDTINFLVNEQPTDASVRISKRLDVDFTPPPETTFSQTITFDNIGTDVGSVASFEWTFGDGQSSTETSPSTMHTYVFEKDSVNVVTVGMVAKHPNGLCSATVEHTFTIVVRDIVIPDGYQYCSTDATPHDIEILPSGYGGEIGGVGVLGGKFRASTVPASTTLPIPITLDGVVMTNVDLCAPADVQGYIYILADTVEFHITGDHNSSAEWSFKNQDDVKYAFSISGADVFEERSMELFKEIANGKVFAFLTIDEGCCDPVTQLIDEIVIPSEAEPIVKTLVLTDKKYCVSDDKTYTIRINPSTETGIITIDGATTNKFTPSEHSDGDTLAVTLDGVFQFSIEICKEPPFPAGISVTREKITVNVAGDITKSKITFEDSAQNNFSTTRNPESYPFDINITKAFTDAEAKGPIFLVLGLSTDCCDEVRKYPIDIPKEGDGGNVKETCPTDMGRKFNAQIALLQQLNQNQSLMEELSSQQKKHFTDIRTFFTISHTQQDFLLGNANAQIGVQVNIWFQEIHAVLATRQNTNLSPLAMDAYIRLYSILYQLTLLALQCQDGSKIPESGILQMLGVLKNQFQKVGSDSFAGIGIDIDKNDFLLNQTSSSASFLDASSVLLPPFNNFIQLLMNL